MPGERESNEIKKSMAYDLIRILERSPVQEHYTVDEIKKIINTYIETTTGGQARPAVDREREAP